MIVVVSQPMFLPWVGLFEQVALADVFVHYDDVQLPRGRSFMSRVQVKTADGPRWMTAPLDHRRSGPTIAETWMDADRHWRQKHQRLLHHALARAPQVDAMSRLAEEIYSADTDNLADFNIRAVERLAGVLGATPRFLRSSALSAAGGSGSERLLSICRELGADTYLTGHGAANYLDHELFERSGIEVRYIDYCARPWPQQHGAFTPYVTVLDLLAARGEEAPQHLAPSSTHWRAHLARKRPG